jgi:prepilin-type N-terminal cleavage/methylation domain-containing protein
MRTGLQPGGTQARGSGSSPSGSGRGAPVAIDALSSWGLEPGRPQVPGTQWPCIDPQSSGGGARAVCQRRDPLPVQARPEPMDRNSLRQRGGFTLVELMVTIIVIGLLASVVGLSWESMLPGQKLNTDIRVLSNLIAQTRSEAIARSAEFWMVYNFEQDAYWMLTPFDEEGQIQFDEEQRRALFKTRLGKGIHFDRIVIDGQDYDINDREVFVRFDPLGSSSEHRIVLSQERPPALFTIEVLGLTGLIRFHDGLFEREEPRDSDFQ